MADPQLIRITVEIVGLGVVVAFVASIVARRHSILRGAIVGSFTAALFWLVLLFIELRYFGRWY